MSLVNSKVHGIDPAMHMCDELCKQTHCDVGNKAIGWIEDKKKERLLIISILWRSQGLFSHGTICYCIQDQHGCDYALKDCWVDKVKKNHEERVLEIVWGIPNVVTLMDTWDVEYEGKPDSTLWIRNLHGTFSLGFRSHKAMVKRNILHGDLSPNNFIIFDGCGYYIDFDHAQIIEEGGTSAHSWGTGTVPYMSIRLLYAATEPMVGEAFSTNTFIYLVGLSKTLLFCKNLSWKRSTNQSWSQSPSRYLPQGVEVTQSGKRHRLDNADPDDDGDDHSSIAGLDALTSFT
ncbi:hypothetical protein BDR04DRAFT_1117537 [Suillus decipiens]|nr:hypothetical protein BDR04DRAFT_1117537 [Suillus decipiens]